MLVNPLVDGIEPLQPILWLLAVLSPGVTASDVTDRESRPCADCHAAIVQTFAVTRMAQGAEGEVFRREWMEQGTPEGCLVCHAPSGGAGLSCNDCHGRAGHPYPRLQVPDICARCHDAPGESTVRRFREHPAALQGKDCLDCHLPPGGAKAGHGFIGPSVAGFLDDVARLRLSLRHTPNDGALVLIRVSHRAGHALPGGTTGRAVWLTVSGLDAEGITVWRETVRYGWERHGENEWQDRTLPPGPPTSVEIALSTHRTMTRLRAELWYRFRAGDLDTPDPRARLLDAVELDLPSPAPADRR
ncbi:hypothetical protein [Allochromatium tepidum]|uniref:Cytochrome c-552/4 domain-containing protein n=1 Tax=Allochromatium tepidum TaxID=553982 RepID=A0ABN6G9W6_9GAMM|nr:hypothetical protein [Allochromatium tepidum]BCU06454.1 hypothetical protein Atep_11310 [Allochromatium tepidum]